MSSCITKHQCVWAKHCWTHLYWKYCKIWIQWATNAFVFFPETVSTMDDLNIAQTIFILTHIGLDHPYQFKNSIYKIRVSGILFRSFLYIFLLANSVIRWLHYHHIHWFYRRSAAQCIWGMERGKTPGGNWICSWTTPPWLCLMFDNPAAHRYVQKRYGLGVCYTCNTIIASLAAKSTWGNTIRWQILKLGVVLSGISIQKLQQVLWHADSE